jgi:CMP-N,N'-diacetyllegionaminic acid synthase
MNVVAIITARGGSKGVPGKNLRLLHGKPLLAYTAEAALAARRLTRVVLSTDDAEIARIGKACGVDVPFLRPPELAADTTPTLPVLQHAVATLEQAGAQIDAVCLLQPTNPFRSPAVIDGCVDLFERSGADSVVTVLPVPHEYNPHWVYFENEHNELHLATGESAPVPRRQSLPPAFHREGSVYVVQRDILMNSGSLYGVRIRGYRMDHEPSVNIDTLDDFHRAEQMLTSMSVSGLEAAS